MAIYTIENLTFSYPEKTRKILDNISIKIEKGEFLVLCGESGCGKTTLLRQLKPTLASFGVKKGEITFLGEEISKLSHREESQKIGFVLQSPDNQIVTDKVWHELAFGLESLGVETQTIRLRVAEMASFFGIENWFYKDVSELSGGQKQLLNLASIMAMQPQVLILDEPTSQLDPISASEFLSTIAKINRELGTTIIMTEHRLDEVLTLADRILVMENGQIIADGKPGEVGEELAKKHHKMFKAMPIPMRVYASVKNDLFCPITARDGRRWLEQFSEKTPLKEVEICNKKQDEKDVIIKMKDVWFRYEKNLPDVIKGLTLDVKKGEFLAIIGGNGTGKTTSLGLISGIKQHYRGEIFLDGKKISQISDAEKFSGLLGVLPQNPQSIFVKNTVNLDLYDTLKDRKISSENLKLKVDNVMNLCAIEHLAESHPYDLSGGEQQRMALAKVLLLEPKILLLDEPTKGLDADFKGVFAGILNCLTDSGVTILMVSHDVEFCAEFAHECALFFDGNIVTKQNPREFFSGNSFYTTVANRISRELVYGIVTADDLIKSCGGNVSEISKIKENTLFKREKSLQNEHQDNIVEESKKKSKKQLFQLIFSVLILFGTLILERDIFLEILGRMHDFGSGETLQIDNIWHYIGSITLLFLSIIGIFTSFVKKSESNQFKNSAERKLSKRTIFTVFLVLLFIPFTIFFGSYFLGDRKFYFISLLIIFEIMLPFLLIFEGRKPQAREVVIIAVLCAIGVAGRSAFFMLPQFKPVVAIVIISGVAFGAETGFLVGAMTVFTSNMFFGQGPWTPWQMFAVGIIGFFAGILFKKGLLARNRLSLSIFGGISTIFVYGAIMDTSNIIIYQSNFTLEMLFATLILGLPFNIIHAIATIFFLWIISQPMLEKLDRIKTKYGLIE